MKIIVTEKQLKFLVEQIDTKGLGQDYTTAPKDTTSFLDTDDEERYTVFGDCERFTEIFNTMLNNYKSKNPQQKDKNFISSAIIGQLNRIDKIEYVDQKEKDFLLKLKTKAKIKNWQDYLKTCDLKDNSKISPENKEIVRNLLKGKPIPHPPGSVNSGNWTDEWCRGFGGAFCGPGGGKGTGMKFR